MRSIIKIITIVISSSLYLLYLAWPTLWSQTTPTNDLAADMLLANRIQDEGYLLVGHYSRWEFNHPGPFYFYYNLLAESLFGWLPISRLQTWQLGNILLQSTLTSFSAIALSQYLTKKINLIYSLFCLLAIIGFVDSNHILSLWMPDRIITAYISFTISMLYVFRGDYKYLIPATMLTSILIHGYVTMTALTIPIMTAGVVCGSLKNGSPKQQILNHKKYILTSMLIAACFALPILLNFIIEPVSNIEKIIKAKSHFSISTLPRAEELFTVILEVLFKKNNIFWLIAFLTILPSIAVKGLITKEQKSKLILVNWLIFFILLLSFIIYRQTPRPVETFTLSYLAGLPALIFSVSLLPLYNMYAQKPFVLKNQKQRKHDHFPFIFIILLLTLPLIKRLPIHPPEKSTLEIAQKIKSITNGRKAIVDYIRHGQWPFIVGILIELDRIGVKSCVTWKNLEFLYTKKRICEPSASPNVLIIPSKDCKQSCLISSGSYGILSNPNKNTLKPDDTIRFDAPNFSFDDSGWSSAEAAFRWSEGKQSNINFYIENKAAFAGTLHLHAGTLGEQRVIMALNGTQIYSDLLSGDDIKLNVSFDKALFKDGNNTLSFQLPDAKQPGNGDPRTLALAFKALKIQ